MGITQHQVNEICFKLDKTEGRNVTHREVRNELGHKGSYSTVSPMIQQWEKNKIDAVEAAYQLSDEVRQALLADVGRAMKKMKEKMQHMIDQKEARLNEMQGILAETESAVLALKERLTQAEDAENKAKGATDEARSQAAKIVEEKETWQAKYHEEVTKLAVMTNRLETVQQHYDLLRQQQPKQDKAPKTEKEK